MHEFVKEDVPHVRQTRFSPDAISRHYALCEYQVEPDAVEGDDDQRYDHVLWLIDDDCSLG